MPATHDNEEKIFHKALEIDSPEEQNTYLESACAGHPALLARVKTLLEASGLQGDLFDAALLDPTLTLDCPCLTEGPSTVIDRYRLLEKIGEGGMAVVYMAEQEKPLHRKVALKIIKLGMDTKQVISRFEAERQALAMMDHPNIARVLDAGATETGRPYFVMELVHGMSITEYCDENRLSARERLDLFIQVCNAVQHAHQKGIIHRDIKPSNVMVTRRDGTPVPKIIDFGIAKAINQKLTEKTLFTRYAHIIGTPAYMSPEQAELSELDIDTRTDIYSLGVLLYELLTGTQPFSEEELRKSGYFEMQRVIREEEPAKPSTKLNTLGPVLMDVAKYRKSTPDLLRKTIRGDLDWIVMKTLEKDRASRYETVHALTEDVQRHLRDEPVLASSRGAIYHFRKFVLRHRARIAVAAALTVLLVALAVTGSMYRQASNLKWAKGEALPRLTELVRVGDYASAFTLAQRVQRYIPDDPTLRELWPRMCREYSVTTAPPGAKVFYREYLAIDASWQYLGKTPLKGITLPQGAYRWKIEKAGFATHERVTEGSFDVKLWPTDSGDDMVWINPWNADVKAALGSEGPTVKAPSFLLDRFEVTNEQFKQFVDQSGYTDRQYWRESHLVKEGKQIPWQQAMAEFVDKTGQLGPATWEAGTYPEGKGKHPVSGISWFEADAYATFVGKKLPTVHHWQRAACTGDSMVIIPFSNFETSGTAPVGSFPGIGYTGLFDIAGNVKEWCWNAADESEGHRYILGGGWGEQTYMFTEEDFRSPWSREATNGLRCMLCPDTEGAVAEVLFSPLLRQVRVRDYSTVKPCSDQEYEAIRQRFDYDRTALNPIVEHIEDSSPFWRHERITFDAAYDDEQMIAHLFLPKGVKPPHQVAVYWPGSGAMGARNFEGSGERKYTEIVVMSGRALMFPIYKGSFERGTGQLPDWEKEPHAVTEWIIKCCKDMQRSVDYLVTRQDIDTDKMAYYGMSAGGIWGPMALAIEERFRTGILVVGGFPTEHVPPAKKAIDPLNHAPRVRVPVLMINGKEDYVFPYDTSQLPMFELMHAANENTEHTVYPGGHGLLGLFREQIRGDVVAWLDRYLGPVK